MRYLIKWWVHLLLSTSFLLCFSMEKEKKRTSSTVSDQDFLWATKDDITKTIAKAYIDKVLRKSRILPINLDAQDSNNNTALHRLALNGNFCAIHLLLRSGADPFIENKFRNYFLLYLNTKMPLYEQVVILTEVTNQAITNRIRDDLIEKGLLTPKSQDDPVTILNKIIAKNKKYSMYSPFYQDFLRQVTTFILLALEDSPEKYAYNLTPEKLASRLTTKKHASSDLTPIDTALPYFDLQAAEQKVSQLLRMLKVIKRLAFNFFTITLTDVAYNAHFNLLEPLHKDPTTLNSLLYLLRAKNIVTTLPNELAETNQEIRSSNKEHLTRREQSSASFIPLFVSLKLKDLPNRPEDDQYMKLIVTNAPISKIKSEQFKLAFTSFARDRDKYKSIRKISLSHRKTL
jgi:hypothetical protein